MRNNPGDRARLQHIYDAILEIESYTDTNQPMIFSYLIR
jgi:hypothetical protein